jgi:hypothetical protein
MSKVLVLAASAAVALVSVAATSDADARHVRDLRGFYGYAPGYHAPRSFRESPTYAPDAPPTRSYNNPGIPDFQNGSRG